MSEIDTTAGGTLKGDSRAAVPGTSAAHVPLTEEQLQAVHVEPLTPLLQPIHIADYDPAWPRLFERELARLHAILGDRMLLLEHIGSTSVPGLAAKPIIDILLVIANSADERTYVPDLEAGGYALRIREPDWYEHRLFKGSDTDINLHVFSSGCPEIERVLLLRNWLRDNPADRQLYEQTKRELARQEWKYVQHYADAKTTVIQTILARAQEAARDEK